MYESFLELLRTRRSVRTYRKSPLSPHTIETLKEAVLRSPSSRDINPWRFIFVDDVLLLDRLACCKKHGSEFLAEAGLGVVICGDETSSDVWVEDCSIAAIILQLACHDLGLGSCWSQVRNRIHDTATTAEAYIQSLLGLPSTLRIECIIGIGYPETDSEPREEKKLELNKIGFNEFIQP
ncbi:MAG: nitroreductase family protein [Chitinivibrionales bacterium]|nr:nitroreductase family protein [Chitinivibrionales bacterium]